MKGAHTSSQHVLLLLCVFCLPRLKAGYKAEPTVAVEIKERKLLRSRVFIWASGEAGED
jgi:hypothetical protein